MAVGLGELLAELGVAEADAAAGVDVHHVFLVGVGQDLDVAGHGERVVELAGGLRVAVLDVADLAVDAHVQAGNGALRVRVPRLLLVLALELT